MILQDMERVSGACTLAAVKEKYGAMGQHLTVTKDSALVKEHQYHIVGTRVYEVNTLE